MAHVASGRWLDPPISLQAEKLKRSAGVERKATTRQSAAANAGQDPLTLQARGFLYEGSAGCGRRLKLDGGRAECLDRLTNHRSVLGRCNLEREQAAAQRSVSATTEVL